MLQLCNIRKVYPAGSGSVEALRGISLQFRRSEFVSILGQSGCGKTTLLNIIGGLDQYTEGDLLINGRSTRDFKDRDWDAYRNHSIGFVFQSYHLIPHQSVLQNVELALTLSGVPKGERRKRAKEALEKVGLGDQFRKKPGEMSGGQMQRVAIARAIVNNPDIILADEPTGALDTETSVQVMEILKEISRDRLVIMVTHNPALAEQYSTRIIKMLDGRITADSAPLSEAEIAALKAENQPSDDKKRRKKTEKKPSMSFVTAFGLSLKNLFTKKGRTALTSFAGSIGIIGIALIYAVSQGTTNYINILQEDTLSSYPLTLEASHIDLGTLLSTFADRDYSDLVHENDAVYQKAMLREMLNAFNSMESTENDLRAFKEYLEKERTDENSETGLHDALSGVQYTYDTDLLVYTKSPDGTVIHSDTQELLRELMAAYFGMDLASGSGASATSLFNMPTMGSGAVLWQEMLSGDDGAVINPLLQKQYDLVYGSWPNSYNEIVLVLDSHNELNDMTLYALGLKSREEIDQIADAALNGTELEISKKHWSYEEICAMEFRTVLNSDCFTLDEKTGLYTDLRETETGLRYLYDNAIPLKVVGILRPNPDAVSSMLNGSIAYTRLLTEYIIEQSKKSPIVTAQLDDPSKDVFTGLPFAENAGKLSQAEKAEAFRHYLSGCDEAEKAEAYIRLMSIPTPEQLDAAVQRTVSAMTRADMEAAILTALTQQTGMSQESVQSYIGSMTDEDLLDFFTRIVSEQVKAQYSAGVRQQLSAMSPQQLAGALELALPSYTEEECARFYDDVLEFSDSTYEENLVRLGCVDLDDPSTINLYASTFNNKDVIEEAIAQYNADREELEQITYTDYVGIMMSSITTIINAITYVLIAFVAVSLVVSSIMIGVITLISVQERTKEIGILRAIGASKKNVSSMFNAETVIIGFTAGLLGVLATALLCIPINLILHSLTDINNLSAELPLPVALILIAISVLLTLFAGIIPSRSAAKKDPVVALRTE